MAGGCRKNQEQTMIAAMIGSRSMADASVKCGVPVRTLYNYLRKPAFKLALREAKSQLLNAAIDKLRDAGCEAVDGLIEIAKDVNATSGARVTAWRSVLEFALRGNEQECIVDRLNELENNLEREPVKEWE